MKSIYLGITILLLLGCHCNLCEEYQYISDVDTENAATDIHNVQEQDITSYTQKQHKWVGTLSLGDNYFKIDVKKQASSENNAIPGVVYIIDRQANKFANIDTYITTTCNDVCTVNEPKPSSTKNCNTQVLSNTDDIQWAFSTKSDVECQIYINLNVGQDKGTNSYSIIQIPNLRVSSTFLDTTKQYPIDMLWPSTTQQVPRYLTINYPLPNREQFDYIINYVKFIEQNEGHIQQISAGTDSNANCKYTFPSKTQSCEIAFDDKTKQYAFDSNVAVQSAYIQVVITENTKFLIQPQYKIICKGEYTYDYTKNKCLIQCADNQYYDGQCKDCLSNCATCTTGTACEKCIDEYILSLDKTTCTLFSNNLIIAQFIFILFLIFSLF